VTADSVADGASDGAGGGLGARIAAALRDVPDFPEPGILFKDIAPLLADTEVFNAVVAGLGAAGGGAVDVVAGVEARGFLFAGALACALGCGVVPVRKAGKLPPPTVRRSYQLEYGSAEIEVPVGLLTGRRVLLVDDVLATGGTLAAAAGLIGEAGGIVTSVAVVVELTALRGRAALAEVAPLHALLAV
jgi:adenine phosphoribosyltransferase